MAILVDASTRLICQGITGSFGAIHTKGCHAYGTKVVGGVTPGKGGSFFEIEAADSGGGFDGQGPVAAARLPVFNTVAEAAKETGADASMIFVPRAFSADAIIEAAEAGLRLICCITEGIPVLAMT